MLISVDATYSILLVGSLFICIIHRHLLQVTSEGHCCIHSVYPSRYRLEALCHHNNVTSYIVFLDILQMLCLQRVLGAGYFILANVTGWKYRANAWWLDSLSTSTSLNILEEALVLLIWTSHVISFWTGGKLTSVDKNTKNNNGHFWWISPWSRLQIGKITALLDSSS